MSAKEALSHPWITGAEPTKDEVMGGTTAATGAVGGRGGGGPDLLPMIKKNFNARRTLHAAIDTIRAINKLREGGTVGMMDGAMSKDPRREEFKVKDEEYPPKTEAESDDAGVDAMEIDSRGNARGQTEEQIRLQAKKVKDLTIGLWERGRVGVGGGPGTGR